MKNNIGIFQCPVCQDELDISEYYIICKKGHKFELSDDIPLMFVVSDTNDEEVTYKVKNFYEENPFPNYDDADNPSVLITKAEKSVFAKMLFDELPFNNRVLEVGCGTGQLTNYLSLAHRYVFGTDISVNSLKLGNNFKLKNGLQRSFLCQMNLFKPCFKHEIFDIIICNGVLHHTNAPFEGFQIITKMLKKGGYIIIGLYNRYGRLLTNIRRGIFKLTGNRLQSIDPYLKRKDIDKVKKKTWFLDQYKNPYESTHSFGEILKWFENTGIEFISSIPAFGDKISNDETTKLFSKLSKGNRLSRFFSQMKMIFTSQREGGFFIMIGKKT